MLATLTRDVHLLDVVLSPQPGIVTAMTVLVVTSVVVVTWSGLSWAVALLVGRAVRLRDLRR